MNSSRASRARTLERFRVESHYLFARTAIDVATVIYGISVIMGALVAMGLHASRMESSALQFLSFTGLLVHIAGAVVVREVLLMIIDIADGAMERRLASAAASTVGEDS